MKRNNILLFLILIPVVACSPSSQTSQPLSPSEVEKVTSVSEEVLDNSKSDWLETCDEQSLKKQQEISQSLDAHNSEIKNFFESNVGSNDNEINAFKVGSLIVRKRQKVSPSEITDEEYGWANLYSHFLEIKNTPIDYNWIKLLGQTRYLLSLDRDRLLYDSNAELDRKSGPLIFQGAKEIYNCLLKPDCDGVLFSKDVYEMLTPNTVYKTFFKAYFDKTDLKGKRDELDRLRKRLSDDYSNLFQFFKNDAVVRKSQNQFEITLKAGDLAGHEKELSDLILPSWQSKNFSVSIKWVPNSSIERAFTIFVKDELGGRSGVQLNQGTIFLAQGTSSLTIPHEFGHALGFKDKYFEVWKPQECIYRDDLDPNDIMSTHDSGSVTDEDWGQLDRAYPFVK